MTRFTTILIVALLIPLVSRAQKGALEMGLDGSLSYILTDDRDGSSVDNLSVLSVPVQSVRLGFFPSDAVSVEPSISLNIISSQGETFSSLGIGLSGQFHVRSDPTNTRPFVALRPHLNVVTNGSSSAQFGVGVQAGVKSPVSGPLYARLAAGVQRDFENDDAFGAITIFASFGFSIFAN